MDTTDGRTYNRTVTDGVIEVAHRLNNLAARKLINKSPKGWFDQADSQSGFRSGVNQAEQSGKQTEPPVGGSPEGDLELNDQEDGGHPE